MEKHDVIIAGAGPAGSACAKALIEEGIDVLVIEKDPLPRHKTCSGILFGQTQILLQNYFGALPPEDVYCNPRIIKAENIKEWSRDAGFSQYTWELPKDGEVFPTDYLNIWRNRFDQWLLKQSGAEFIQNCSVRGFKADEKSVIVELLDREKTRVDSRQKEKAKSEAACSYLVGADGGGSLVRRLLNAASSPAASPEVVIYQTYNTFSAIGTMPEATWLVFFEPAIGDILCCVHQKDDVLTLCVGGFKGRDITAGMAAFKHFLKENFEILLTGQERVEGCVMRMDEPYLGQGRVLLTGEAANIIYLNGEGISAAIDSGYRAGKAIARALKNGTDALSLYREQSADILQHVHKCVENMHFLTQKQ